MEEPLEEILKTLKEAEERWRQLLEKEQEEKKPEVLNIGPRPKVIKKPQKEDNVKYPIFPLPNCNKSRGGRLNRAKKELGVLLHMAEYEVDNRQKILEKIEKAREEIKNLKKLKKNKI